MVFKTVSGIAEDPYDAYNSAHVIAEEEISALDVTNNYAGNYKNRIVLNWNNVGPTEASVVLYRRGIVVKELKFNATGTNKLNWFARDKLGGNPLPWSDIKVAPHNNFFTIEGDRTVNRRFFINSLYNGCPGDKGWMVITSGPDDTCSWAQYFGVRSILYSNLNTLTNWNDFGFVGQADVLAVYVK